MRFKKRITQVICLFFLLLVTGCLVQPAVRVEALAGFDALFDNRKGWTGADGAYSISLTDDLTLWLFGDTWMGDIRDGEHVNATIVNNTVAIQHGLSPSKATVEFYFGRTLAGKPGAFIRPADGRGWFWIYHGVLTGRVCIFSWFRLSEQRNPLGLVLKSSGHGWGMWSTLRIHRINGKLISTEYPGVIFLLLSPRFSGHGY
jgi:hypothetical protein